MAIKILELLGDYQKVLHLTLLSSSIEEYEKLRLNFQLLKCLNSTDYFFINNTFTLMKQQVLLNPNRMKEYNKIFDKDEGEHFIFETNQNKLSINSTEDIKNKIQKEKSKLANIEKKR